MSKAPHPMLPPLLVLLESARRDIVICCPEAIMSVFDSDDAISEMVRVARRAPQTGLKVLLREYEPVRLEGSRFIQSMQRIPTKAECRLLEDHPEWRTETLVVVDEAEGLIVAHKTGRLTSLSERAQVRIQLNRFITLWDAARPAHEMRRLR